MVNDELTKEGKLIIATNIVVAKLVFELLSATKYGKGDLAIPSEKQIGGHIKSAFAKAEELYAEL